MRKYLLAATAAAAFAASPAMALDNAWYVGVEGGPMLMEDMKFDFRDATRDLDDGIVVDHNTGFDVDLIGGYDFGMFRAEAEIGYKRAQVDMMRFDPILLAPTDSRFAEASGRSSALSSMLNLLLDFGVDDRWGGFVGAGVGLARIKVRAEADALGMGFNGTDSGFAWQGVGGVRYAITPTVDLGLKYRFFNANKLRFDSDDGLNVFDLDGRWRSHSLLASLIFNFAPPAPVIAPPPPPPPPATQTCPDGSVILATDVCPAPPPPPPPPPPAGERG